MEDKRNEAMDLMRNAKFSAAIPIFLDLIESDSGAQDSMIHHMLGQCYKFNGQLPEAIESLKKAHKLVEGQSVDPEIKGPMYLALGIAYQDAKEFDKASSWLSVGINECPTNWLLHNSLGLTFKLLGDPRKALECYRVAQELIVENAGLPGSRTMELDGE